MIFIGVTVFLLVVVFISRRFGRECSERSGSNIAEKHFREKWGMDEKTEYHD